MKQKRLAFWGDIGLPSVSDLILLDESNIDTHLVRRIGRAAPGERALGSLSFGGYKLTDDLGCSLPEGAAGAVWPPYAG